MSPADEEIIREIPGLIRVFKDGRIEKFRTPVIVPAGIDPSTGVISKDFVFSPENNNFVRIYIPKTTVTKTRKLPLLIYFHGGGFVIESAASATYQGFLNLVVAEAEAVVVSVDYRLAPESPLPAAYEDSWAAIRWVADHGNGNGPDPWLNQYADLQNVFLAGDSAGGNIAHHMAIRVGSDPLPGFRIRGNILLHPYFWGKERVGTESEFIEGGVVAILDDLWALVHPGGIGPDDPFINPDSDPNVAGMGCSKILVCVGGKDILKERGWHYKQVIEKSGWKGELEVVEDKGEDHVFFLMNPSAPNACTLRTRICTFINN